MYIPFFRRLLSLATFASAFPTPLPCGGRTNCFRYAAENATFSGYVENLIINLLRLQSQQRHHQPKRSVPIL